jgi:hypothetical protein
MAGKNITLKRAARINGKLYKPGDKAQVSTDLYAELELADALELDEKKEAAKEKADSEAKKGK